MSLLPEYKVEELFPVASYLYDKAKEIHDANWKLREDGKVSPEVFEVLKKNSSPEWESFEELEEAIESGQDLRPAEIIESETKDKVSSIEPREPSLIETVAHNAAPLINRAIGTGTATAEARTFEELPDEIKSLPEKFKYTTSEDAAKSVQRNNPMNVEIRKDITWQGQVKSDSKRFMATDSPLNGLRAGYINMLAKFKRGLTLGETIEKLSPESDKNPTPAMIKVASKMSGIGANEKIEISMDNFEAIKQFGLGLLKFEAPGHTYPDSMINEAVKLAIEQKTRTTKQVVKDKSKMYPPPKTFKKTEVNIGAKSLPKVQGEVIEEVAQKAIKNPNDGLWDFKKNTIRPIKDMARAALNTVPMHLRFVVDYVKDNKLLGGGEQEVVTERHMTPEVVKVLKTAVYNAKKRGTKPDAKGFFRVEYSDYPMTKSGVSVQSLFQAGTLTKEQADAGRKRWGASFGGVMRMIGDAFDPVVASSGTFGRFGFKEVNGEIIIDDVYDFSKFKGEATTAYSAIRKWISTEQGDKTYKTTARLGKIEKDDLV